MNTLQEHDMLVRVNTCMWQLAKAVGMVGEGQQEIHASPEEITDQATSRLLELEALRATHSEHVEMLRSDLLRQGDVIAALTNVIDNLAEQLATTAYHLGRVEFVADAAVDVMRLLGQTPVPDVAIHRAERLVQCYDDFKESDQEPGR